MNTILFLFSLISLLTLVFGQGDGLLNASYTPTACPVATGTVVGWMPAATNPAAIPKGLLSPCQLNCLYDGQCPVVATTWISAFLQKDVSIHEYLCDDPAASGYYISDLQLCVQCLADALYLANQENPRSQHTHRIPDIYGLNGLEAQLTDGIASWCENGTDSAESLEEFLCLGREITQRFGGPTVYWNFTLDVPGLAYDGVHDPPPQATFTST